MSSKVLYSAYISIRGLSLIKPLFHVYARASYGTYIFSVCKVFPFFSFTSSIMLDLCCDPNQHPSRGINNVFFNFQFSTYKGIIIYCNY
jgi:hypothetical protein